MTTRLAFAMLACAAVSALAQTDTRATERSGGLSHVACGPDLPPAEDFCVYFNGYYWKLLNDSERSALLAAYGQGIKVALMRMLTEHNELGEYKDLSLRFIPRLKAGETTIAALNAFYATPENLGMPINFALQLISAKAVGVSDAEIRNQDKEFRRLVVEGSTRK
jgi:hypothetical protein